MSLKELWMVLHNKLDISCCFGASVHAKPLYGNNGIIIEIPLGKSISEHLS